MALGSNYTNNEEPTLANVTPVNQGGSGISKNPPWDNPTINPTTGEPTLGKNIQGPPNGNPNIDMTTGLPKIGQNPPWNNPLIDPTTGMPTIAATNQEPGTGNSDIDMTAGWRDYKRWRYYNTAYK